MNKGNNDLTMEMQEASFPVVYMELDENLYNELHGYAKSMNIAYMRDCITALGENRNTNFVVKTFTEAVAGISYEVRSVDGARLIENATITDCVVTKEKITGKIALKDLIEENEEYSLIILISLEDGRTIRYYTRVIWSHNYHVSEKIAYVFDFNEKTFDKNKAKELSKYLETNSAGDNTTLNKVDIHCSLNQVTWGNLNVKKEMTPVANIVELAEQTASINLYYLASVKEGETTQYYYVEEFYRIRYTVDRMYLLDFERTMNRIFREKDNVYANDKIMLGIVGQDTPFKESEDGNNLIFIVQNKLCEYNVTDNKLAVLFSFYNENNIDVRTIYNSHNIKVLDVDEAGNVSFVVYGYMNRGRHEGEVGVQVYFYNSTLNTIEEKVYIPYSKSYQILEAEMGKLLYINRESYLYLYLEETVYEVNLTDKNYSSIIQTNQDGSLQVSEDQKMIAWQKGDSIYNCQEIIFMNLNTREEMSIKARSDEYLLPLGFMGEDLIYGFARETDIIKDGAGRVTFPMYRICISGADGKVLKEYKQEDVYIVGCTIKENQISLDRYRRTEDGNYVEITADQIMNNHETSVGKNRLSTVGIDVYQKIVQIAVKKDINAKTIKILTPKEVLFEGGRELELSSSSTVPKYYVYGSHGVYDIYRSPANAVNKAYEISGVVVNDSGKYVWIKGNKVTRNQIMAITGSMVTEEKDSVAVCLDTILKFEGIIRNSEYLLSHGETIYSVLESNLREVQVLDLKGCPLDAVLYYVNRDIPVFASLNDQSAVLIVGYNDYNIVIMDPKTGKVEKKGMNDSIKWLEENGNCFITYIK